MIYLTGTTGMIMSDGSAAERLLSGALERLGNQDVCNDVPRANLLAVARQLRVGSMNLCQDRLGVGDELWDKVDSKFILDKLFAIDSLLGPPGKRVAFDATTNLSKVEDKLGNHKHFFNELWVEANLGIVKSAIVSFVPNPDYGDTWGWALLSEEQKEALTEEVFGMLCDIDDDAECVQSYEIHF